MPDYGHDLLFGAGIDSYSHQSSTVVRLAELADQTGVDLAAISDHPYHPAFLDTWTLLSYLAGRTTQIRLAASVHPIPLRQPAILARSAASLDILSGGRFELGLGAGAIWDGIEAMGGPRRSPGEAVDALEEAIEVIRGIWDVDTSGGVHVDGNHYQVRGARPGPRPSHNIGIWTGAYKPRMLRLTGRMADGWWPSLPALEEHGPITLAEGNATIDEAAIHAGRSPQDVRRLLNLGELLPVEQIAELALQDGISVFTVDARDPRAIHQLAKEISPAVKELVAKERAGR
ncbi:LLM class flavin-dependent oxidoreductase [Actinobacteria bacterium YIM 96077]|uniref:LLM class flavin-dependent oxidoreductase n=1 Tax=Phytoactinopolyspora halophila TaxID=1981511 RepID=A0A329QVN9_9ACTN|nr:LLM class flavin-dependent oxidoreductase [Phytoactinopolyspora halophila]AYY12810.1 LLM class flavin-dependent oxidoreductase [Actinobacteria bacterium YIM 96077]RAW16397.1 LLM class flavin-dependent oxidoreductase [Phytoactinopolyspora halophila]